MYSHAEEQLYLAEINKPIKSIHLKVYRKGYENFVIDN